MKNGFTAKKTTWASGAGADPVQGFTVEQYHNGRCMAQQFVPAESYEELQKIFPDVPLDEWALHE